MWCSIHSACYRNSVFEKLNIIVLCGIWLIMATLFLLFLGGCTWNLLVKTSWVFILIYLCISCLCRLSLLVKISTRTHLPITASQMTKVSNLRKQTSFWVCSFFSAKNLHVLINAKGAFITCSCFTIFIRHAAETSVSIFICFHP